MRCPRHRWIVVLACLGMWSCHSRGPGVAKATKPQSESLLKTANQLFQDDKYAEAVEVFKRAAAAAEQEGDPTVRVQALSMTARAYLARGEADQGRGWLGQAGQLATPEYPEGWSSYVGARGRFEWKDEKDTRKAELTFKDMYEFCLKNGLHSAAIDAAHMVAITGSPDEQVEWALKGIAAAQQGHEVGWLGPLWNNLGWTYDERGEYEKALDAFLKARTYHYMASNDLSRLVADIFVGRAYRMSGDLDEAERWIVKAHDRARQLLDGNPHDDNYRERLGNTQEELGEIAAARGDSGDALQHLKTAFELLKDAGAETWDPDGLARLSRRIEELARYPH